MTEERPFQEDLARTERALSKILSAPALAWQLGGTIVASLLFSILLWVSCQALMDGNGAVAFLLAAVGFVAAYVVLCVTGLTVMRTMAVSGEDSPAAPLHFLIDHIGAAALVPLVLSGGAVILAAVISAFAALWDSGIWQAILVIPSVVVFVLVLVALAVLFVALFLAPATVVVERLSFKAALKRLGHVFLTRKMSLARVFGIGLTVSVILIIPVLVLVSAALGVCSWIYVVASGEYIEPFASFILALLKAGLLWAPILTVPLAFLNALALGSYEELMKRTCCECAEPPSSGAGEEAPTDAAGKTDTQTGV